MTDKPLRFLALVAFALLLSACAVSPVKPLYPAESARLRPVEVRVSAPPEPLSVEELTSQTTVNPVGPGAYSGAGILGAVIGAVIVDSTVAAQAKKQAETLRLQLAGLVDQVRGVDYFSVVARNLQTGLGGDRVRITAVRETPPAPPSFQAEIARATNADATLFVNIEHTFLNNASGSSDGGINTSFRARVALVGKDGKELLKDSIVFVAPRSADADNDARVTWWRDQASYRETLSGTVDGGLALALQDQGAMTRTSQSPWTTRLTGLITVEGGQARCRASGGIDDARGVHVRDWCWRAARRPEADALQPSFCNGHAAGSDLGESGVGNPAAGGLGASDDAFTPCFEPDDRHDDDPGIGNGSSPTGGHPFPARRIEPRQLPVGWLCHVRHPRSKLVLHGDCRDHVVADLLCDPGP